MAYANPGVFDFNKRPPNFRQDTDEFVWKSISPVDVAELTEQENYQLRGAALVWLNRGAAGLPLYMKTHCANITLDHEAAMIPVALTESVLYMVRDPRDVLVSLADHLALSIDETIEVMGDRQRVVNHKGVLQVVGSWSLNVRSWTRVLRYSRFVLRYEDLLEDPDRWFREILGFYDIKIDEHRFADALLSTNFRNLQAHEARTGYRSKSKNQAKFFRRGKAGGWRDVLTDEQADRVASDHGDVMKEYGYVQLNEGHLNHESS